jgi:hypothetical protein
MDPRFKASLDYKINTTTSQDAKIRAREFREGD